MTTIKVFDTSTEGEREVDAYSVRGVWAVHRTLHLEGRLSTDNYTVTHVPTGAAIVKQVGLDDAQQLADRLPLEFAANAGFGRAAVLAAGNRKDALEVQAVLARWRTA